MKIIDYKIGLFLMMLSLTFGAYAQQKRNPVIENYGTVYYVKGVKETPDIGKNYKILVDITQKNDNEQSINSGLEHIARLINLFGLYGISPDDISITAVIHGNAIDMTVDQENKNRKVMEILNKHGVNIFVCAQTLYHNNYTPEEVTGDLQIAASAMNVLVDYQLQDYQILYY